MKNLFFILLSLIAFSGCKKEKTICPDHYTGSDCKTQIAPLKITITKADILSFDATNSGANWDAGGALDGGPLPDLHITLSAEGGPVKWDSETKIDCAPDQDHTFVNTGTVQFTLSEAPSLILKLMDDDVSYMTVIKEFTFSPYNATNQFPSVIHLESGSNKIDLSVSYSW